MFLSYDYRSTDYEQTQIETHVGVDSGNVQNVNIQLIITSEVYLQQNIEFDCSPGRLKSDYYFDHSIVLCLRWS